MGVRGIDVIFRGYRYDAVDITPSFYEDSVADDPVRYPDELDVTAIDSRGKIVCISGKAADFMFIRRKIQL